MKRKRYLSFCALLGISLLLFGSLSAQASPPKPALNPQADDGENHPTGTISLPAENEKLGSENEGSLPIPVQPVPPAGEEILEGKIRPFRSLKQQAAEKLKGASLSQTPDLRPYAPAGWSDALVPSSVAGTHTVNTLYAGQLTYIDWAVLNDSTANITARFFTYLYFDGNRIASWYTDGLYPYWYAYASDWAYTVSVPGWHTLRLVVDATGVVAEANENNNTWERTFYWQGPTQPNLKPYQPAGWSGAIVPASVLGTSVAGALYAGQPTYIDWAILNESGVPAGTRIYIYLFLDGLRIASWYADSLLPHWQAYVYDWPYTVSTPGWHTLRLLVDATDAVAESDEADNTWEQSFYWQDATKPNLKPYTPTGWSSPLVLSTLPGTSVISVLFTNQPIYVDWAVLNDSSVNASARFYHRLYMDEQQIASWYTDMLPGRWYTYINDWVYTVSVPGWHKFKLVTDATNAITETDEADNTWEADFWFEERQQKSVGVEWVNSYYRSGLENLQYNDRNARGFFDELGRIGWIQAFQWGNYSAWEKDFKDRSKGGLDHEVVDNVAFAFFSGHGSKHGLRFDTLYDDYELHYDDALWGDGSLNWLAVDACQVLNDDDGGCIARWGRTFKGLHMILGFDTNCHDVPHRGENLARYADGSYWWAGSMPIKDAWFQAAAITEDSSTYSAVLIALQPPIDPSNDYLPGIGSYSADPVTPTQFYLWRVQN